MTQFTVGVEEEYLVVDRESRDCRPRGERILPTAERALGDEVSPELSPSQLEIGTPICTTLAEVRGNLERLRGEVAQAAAAHGSAIAALATHPFADWLAQGITHKDRYEHLDDVYQQLAREHLISGCHVHVAVDDRDLAVQAMDRVVPWLPVLVVLSANSPFWRGVDTGYASYRTPMFDRWPTAGPPSVLGSRAAFDAVVDDLVAVGQIEDASNLYWDARPSCRYETLEIRCADLCLTVDDAVLVAGLARSLVRTMHAAVVAGEPAIEFRPEVLRAARWRAARFGLQGELIDVTAREAVGAAELVDRLLRTCRADLEAHGEWDEVSALAAEVVGGGNGADRQRAAFARRGSYTDVVDLAIAGTGCGGGGPT
jgi:glutamate---cysteine ligase / carboxylate-amine ligase